LKKINNLGDLFYNLNKLNYGLLRKEKIITLTSRSRISKH